MSTPQFAPPPHAPLPMPAVWQAQFGLTPREAEVAHALILGRSTRDMARQFNINYETVRTHLQRLRDKTGTRRQAETVGLLLRTGQQTGQVANVYHASVPRSATAILGRDGRAGHHPNG